MSLQCSYDYDAEPGDTVWYEPRAPWFMCFECGWRYQELSKHGYALPIGEDMRRLFNEHSSLVDEGAAGCG